MAYWYKYNKQTVSDTSLSKKITVGFQGIPNVIEALTTFHIGSHHYSGGFEGLTGYMPMSFSKFYTYNPATRSLVGITDFPPLYAGGNGAIVSLPVILATADGSHAMGVYSPDQSRYVYVTHPGAQVQKWDCDNRIENLSSNTPARRTRKNWISRTLPKR